MYTNIFTSKYLNKVFLVLGNQAWHVLGLEAKGYDPKYTLVTVFKHLYIVCGNEAFYI